MSKSHKLKEKETERIPQNSSLGRRTPREEVEDGEDAFNNFDPQNRFRDARLNLAGMNTMKTPRNKSTSDNESFFRSNRRTPLSARLVDSPRRPRPPSRPPSRVTSSTYLRTRLREESVANNVIDLEDEGDGDGENTQAPIVDNNDVDRNPDQEYTPPEDEVDGNGTEDSSPIKLPIRPPVRTFNASFVASNPDASVQLRNQSVMANGRRKSFSSLNGSLANGLGRQKGESGEETTFVAPEPPSKRGTKSNSHVSSDSEIGQSANAESTFALPTTRRRPRDSIELGRRKSGPIRPTAASRSFRNDDDDGEAGNAADSTFVIPKFDPKAKFGIAKSKQSKPARPPDDSNIVHDADATFVLPRTLRRPRDSLDNELRRADPSKSLLLDVDLDEMNGGIPISDGFSDTQMQMDGHGNPYEEEDDNPFDLSITHSSRNHSLRMEPNKHTNYKMVDDMLVYEGSGTASNRKRGFLAHGGAGGAPVLMGEGYIEGVVELRSEESSDDERNQTVMQKTPARPGGMVRRGSVSGTRGARR